MPHMRARYSLKNIEKKLTFVPVLLVQGARQVGKSFLMREFFSKKFSNAKYVTLDKASNREFALSNPETFVLQNKDAGALIIDEAQKAPPLFDTIKSMVDEDRRPGQFILLGSTEFSLLTNVRESLTGRASRIRVFPFLLSETKHLPLNDSRNLLSLNKVPRISRKDLLIYLEHGGMPGLFSIRSNEEREILFNDWLALTCERDILNIKKYKLDPDLCWKIVKLISDLDDTSAGSLAKRSGIDLRRINTHLKGLESLFVINKLETYAESTGKDQFYILDVGFTTNLKASFEKRLLTFIYQELLAQFHYRGEFRSKIYYYRSTKGKKIDFVVELNSDEIILVKVFSKEKINELDIRLLESTAEKIEVKKVHLIGLGPIDSVMKINDVTIYPWESIC